MWHRVVRSRGFNFTDVLFTVLTMTTQREDILAHACDLFLERGIEGFSMRRLAESVGVTAPALYRHFEGREDVLLAVVGEAYKVFYQYLHRGLSGSDPAERFRLAGEAYLDFALDHPRFYEMIHAPLEALGIEEVPEDLQAEACAVGQFWHDRLRECMDDRIIANGDPEYVGLTIWSHAHGLISLYLRGMLGEMEEEAFRTLYRESSSRLMDGIGEEGWRECFEAGEEERESSSEVRTA